MSANSQVARNQSRQTFDSVYESTNPLTTVAGQHMVEWFTGNSLNTDRWTTSLVDDATVAMNDSVNGGILFTSGTGLNETSAIHLGGKEVFAHNGAVLIAVYQRIDSNNRIDIEFSASSSTVQLARFRNSSSDTNLRTQCRADGSFSTVDSSVPNHTNRQVVKIQNNSSSVDFSVDGALIVTQTNYLADSRQEVFLADLNLTAGAKTSLVSYCEAYNV